MRFIALVLLFTLSFSSLLFAQNGGSGILAGNVIDEKQNALRGATVQLTALADSQTWTRTTDAAGAFGFTRLEFGHYRLRITYVGMTARTIDSIHLRMERSDFQLNDILMQARSSDSSMETVVIYAEKPLIQSRDGNITFNAGESALSAGSNASDLLQNVPLVTKDPGGKLLVRGREPRVLIDDKPVELNSQQLQDLLESMPGSSIEKVEVMTNPSGQFAGESGGVINIVTRKGSVGKSGRVSVFGGTRGEAGVNASYNYRRKGMTFNLSSGLAYNRFTGEGYSRRTNGDSSALHTSNAYTNRNLRPNLRANLSYEFNKAHSISATLLFNANGVDNVNSTEYRNFSKTQAITRLTTRDIGVDGLTLNPNLNLAYTWRTKRPGENLQVHAAINYSAADTDRDFYQRFLNPDYTYTGVDSSQQQRTDNRTMGNNLRLNYDRPLGKKTSFSAGAFHNRTRSGVDADATFFRKSDGSWARQDLLSADFRFRQQVTNLRTSLKQVFTPQFSATAGLNAERTAIDFQFYDRGQDTSNSYWSFLPFATLNRNWKNILNLTLSYRRTLRRPGIGELNPTVDYSDPYNLRFGNPGLLASPSHNFDLVLGRTKNSFFANFGLGYNSVQDIFAPVRTLLPDGRTEITYQNISGRKEYEVSTWSGLTLTKQLRVNLSTSYTYNQYSAFDKQVRKYRNGGSLTSNLNGNFTWKELYTTTGSFTLNRFANPQGTVRSTLSMNLGFQVRMLKKRMTATLNLIDPLVRQENRSFTYGPNFVLENYSTTRTRNLRLTLGYSFSNAGKKPNPAKLLEGKSKIKSQKSKLP